MHILIVNDDGPPSPHSSPYVHSLVRTLQSRGHVVSVCLPHTQRSWIGKAHMIGQTVKPSYYRPPPSHLPPAGLGSDSHGTVHPRPSPVPGVEEWILVDGTPASCVQIGLYHYFKEKGPVDLVLSGPNYGRNTTAVFALSSGTLGGALEAAVCGRRAVALSYAFFSRNHDAEIVAAASRHSVKVVEALVAQWPADGSVDLYSVNVPLVEGVEGNKTLVTGVLQNYWGPESCFAEDEGSVDGVDEEEERIREGEEGEQDKGDGLDRGEKVEGHVHKHRHFKWAPRLSDVLKSVENGPPGNDGWAVKERMTSVTPLKANFMQAATSLHGKELQLAFAIIDYEDSYVQPLLLEAFTSLFPNAYTLHPPTTSLSTIAPNTTTPKIIQIAQYEKIDFEYAASHPQTTLVNSYMIRKALIRKHFLSSVVDNWTSKHPESILKTNVKRAEAFEVDYAEFLDDALVEAFDLRASLERNGETDDAKEREWWILKPSMSDRGQGIRLFSTMEELQDIFDRWEEDAPDSDEEDEENSDSDSGSGEGEDGKGEDKDYITTSHLRHFVAQPYIDPPLLLPQLDNRKFHVRTYVLAVGSLKVYVYKHMLALFAGKTYQPPWVAGGEEGGEIDLDAHLTNTCLQGPGARADSVMRFADLPLPASLGGGKGSPHDVVVEQILAITGDVFEAAARTMMVHFQPQANAFEVFGVDFLVDARGTAWLLEINAFPDFKQTGDDPGLRDVVAGFWKGTVGVAVGGSGFLDGDGGRVEEAGRDMVLVREVDLGRR
ncbi:tubulin-tyrosine ligase family protein-like protein [Coniochaeta ligniaria NRRL 30616]|uniref:Tubulin-tyrosine ligase family protein-like protein n=1 Tax=Coniochaeta ligniaria NRRL 30616 TaxID=1408157 RepID=A0A1J7JC43_9PEZI|nr:tubulin-tyrosine ligase family protein-like protein [Coniochaeta ligniaria NRRL 30616]